MPSKILIVDDDTSVTEALSLILNRNGYEISTAHDGERAWDALLNSCPDVVLLDLRLPLLSGREILKRLKSAPELANIPVIVMSAEAAANLPKDVEFVEKPIQILRLLNLIEIIRLRSK